MYVFFISLGSDFVNMTELVIELENVQKQQKLGNYSKFILTGVK